MLSAIAAKVGSAVLPGVFRVIDKAVADKDMAAKLKHDLQMALYQGELAELESASKIIVAEAQGESWLQRNWRPLMMVTFGGLIVARWLGFTTDNITTELEMKLFDILQVGIGGYIVSRGVEKSLKTWKAGE